MAARHHRVPHGETEHLGGRIILVSLFGRTTCNKTRLLVIIGLSCLYIAYLRVIEIAEHLGKKSGFRHVIRIKCRDDFVPFKDRKSTRLNSSHSSISYAVFCLKKK